MDFEFPRSKKEFLALDISERNMLTYLFGKRVLQATEELQNFGFSMWLNPPKRFNQEVIENCFRVLSYTPLYAFYINVEEEYQKALALADTKVKAFWISGFSLIVLGIAIFFNVLNPNKILGG